MTNTLFITNIVWMISSNTVPVSVSDWATQTTMFIEGFSDAFPLAIALSVVWAIISSLRAGHFPTTRD